jgi:hypothetical protein
MASTESMKSISAGAIPEPFWRVEYDQSHDPDTPALPNLSDSANCQILPTHRSITLSLKYLRFGQVTSGRTAARLL